ncbi:MAG TPA: tetratricopeptide repeat protein [Cyclobacteriaceae bacterium]|nr:tetratricopeptide repeat protein [Cyclobacteriaceae bacterium]
MTPRRKWCVVLFTVLFTPFCCLQAQQQTELDSLLKALPRLPADTVKTRIYGRVSYLYSKSHSQNEQARKYADSTRLLSETLHFDEGIALSHYYYANIDIFEANYDPALEHLQKYLHFFEQKPDSFKMANALFAIGKIYKARSDFDKAIETYYRLARISERTNNTLELAMTWNSLGGIFRQMQKYDKAIAHYKQANEVYRSLKMTKDYGMGLMNMGNVYNTMKIYDSALHYDTRALEIIRPLKVNYEEAIVLGNLATVYQQMKQYQKALPYELQSLSIKRTLPNKRSLAFGLHDVGLTYLKLNQFTQADAHLMEGLNLATEIKAKDLLQAFYETLAELALAKNDFRSAYNFILQSQQWKDSVFNEQSAQQINELQAKYEAEKKDNQISLLAKEGEIQKKEVERQATLKLTFIGGLLLVTLLAGLILYSVLQRLKNQKNMAKKDHELTEARFMHEIATLEMKALRAQINPHFLFNCINSINVMIANNENEKASQYLAKFSKLIRQILENSETSNVSLDREMLLVESYIQLEELRFKGKINYQISIDSKISPEDTYLPSMVLQPFVENAIWHGLLHKGKNENGLIRISVQEEEQTLRCIVEDNGVGRERARELSGKNILKSKSMGIKITEDRLRLLSKERLKELVRITDLKDALNHALGTRVEINIPIS